MRICDRCGKGVQVGMNVSHSHVRTKKRSYPNLHAATVKMGRAKQKLRLCTKCLRMVKKEAQREPAKQTTEVEKVGSPA